MYASVKTPAGLIAPVKINEFEFQRRYLDWKKRRDKEIAQEKLKDTDTRRGLYYLRNYGVDGLLKLDSQARSEKKAREAAEAERLADMMCMEAVNALKKGLI